MENVQEMLNQSRSHFGDECSAEFAFLVLPASLVFGKNEGNQQPKNTILFSVCWIICTIDHTADTSAKQLSFQSSVNQ